METTRTIGTALYTRELRRRAGSATRQSRGSLPPSTPGRQRPGGGCCLIVLIGVLALVVYLFLEVYVLNPEKPKKTGMAPSCSIARLAEPPGRHMRS